MPPTSDTSATPRAMAVTMFLIPEFTRELKLAGLPGLFAEIALALWLLFKGLPRVHPVQPESSS
jgi:hypothetical protein